MIRKKLLVILFFILFLNGCVQSTAFLGPALTVGSTGNIYQAGLSYASSETITKVTGKTPTENVKNLLKVHKDKMSNNKNSDNDFDIVKIINKNSGVKNLTNQ